MEAPQVVVLRNSTCSWLLTQGQLVMVRTTYVCIIAHSYIDRHNMSRKAKAIQMYYAHIEKMVRKARIALLCYMGLYQNLHQLICYEKVFFTKSSSLQPLGKPSKLKIHVLSKVCLCVIVFRTLLKPSEMQRPCDLHDWPQRPHSNHQCFEKSEDQFKEEIVLRQQVMAKAAKRTGWE